MEDKLQALKQRLAEVDDLNMAGALLNWDQTTYMPEGGAPARGRQMATLSKLAHEKFTDAEIGRLLDALGSGKSARRLGRRRAGPRHPARL